MARQMTLEERKSATTKKEILVALEHNHKMGAPHFTRREIAEIVARKVTPRLISLIEELCADDHLMRGVQIWPNGARGYIYAVKEWYSENE